MTRRVLLTGATGFVGRQILKSLLANNYLVRTVIRPGKAHLLPMSTQIYSIVTSSDIFQESADWWYVQASDIEIVIHAAWYAEPGEYIDSEKNIDCLLGTLEMAKGLVASGIRKFVGIGTCFEYDLRLGELSINSPLNPLNLYSSAKASRSVGLLAFNSSKFMGPLTQVAV